MSDKNENSTNKPSGSFSTFRKLVSPRSLKGVGIFAVALATLIALFYAIENWRGAREWNRVRAMMVEKGEPLSFAELVPVLPPDEDNFAMSPYFEAALDKTIDPETGEARWQIWHQDRNDNQLPKLGPLGLGVDGIWRLGERAKVVWRPWELNEVARDLGMLLNTNEPFGVLRQFVDLADPDLAQIEEDLERPDSQFPIHYEDNVSALLPHLSEIKRLTRLFSFRALTHLNMNEPEAALNDISTMLRLADSIAVEPILISQLVRQAVVGLALQPVWEGLADQVWTAEQLTALQSTLQEIDLLSGHQHGMRGERTFGTDFCDIVERERNLDYYGDLDSDFGASLRIKLVNLGPKGWYLHNKAFMTRMHNEYSIGSVDPEKGRVYLDQVRKFEKHLIETLGDDRKLFIAKVMMPALGKAAIRAADRQSSVDLAVVACGLERYRLQNGVYPDALSALLPNLVSELPHDVVDGEPLRYRKTEDAFVLYSIGANETDDGGVPGFRDKNDKKTRNRDEGDWAWDTQRRSRVGLSGSNLNRRTQRKRNWKGGVSSPSEP